MAGYHGMNGAIWINGSKWATGVSYHVNVNRPTVDASVFGDEWQVNLAGLPAVDGSFEGLWSGNGDAAVGASVLGRVQIAIYPSDGTNPAGPGSMGAVASGMGYVFAGVAGAVNDAIRVSGTFKGTGTWVIS